MDLLSLPEISIFRLVLCFVFLTFIPGFFLLHILKLNKLGLTEKFVISEGLSISLLMFAGLFINLISTTLGYKRPLSTNFILIYFIIILILAAIACLFNQKASFARLYDFKLNAKEKSLLLLPSIFPLLSILGMHLMNITSNNIILILMLFLISFYAIFLAIMYKQIPNRVYPPMIFLISVSLILMLGLRSNHILGSDIYTEYYIFKQTFSEGQWSVIFKNSPLDCCLSISILPTLYQLFLDISPEYIFKSIYPLLFSISPLVVYLISMKYLNSFYAFLSSLFFMSQIYFLGAAYSPRTVLAILFFALAICVLFIDEIDEFNKKILFIVFISCCVFSHYSTTYIFFIELLLSWIGMNLFLKIESVRRMMSKMHKVFTAKRVLQISVKNYIILAYNILIFQSKPKIRINIAILILFFVMIFVWYSQATNAAFDNGVGFICNTLISLNHFFSMESRMEEATTLGAGIGNKGIPAKISFIFNWLTIAFIAIGVLTTFVRNHSMIVFPGENNENVSCLLSKKLEAEFFILALASSAILVIAVAMPYIFKGYGMDRAYCMMMVILSTFFVIGGLTVSKILHIRCKPLMVMVVLIPFFLFSTGLIYQILGIGGAITLNSGGDQYISMYVHDTDVLSAKWLNQYASKGEKIYTDTGGEQRLLLGYNNRSNINKYYFKENRSINAGYIYLIYRAIIYHKVGVDLNSVGNLNNYSHLYKGNDKIYDNGYSEIY